MDARRNSLPQPAGQARTVARGLGWFSIGLGLAQLLAPGAVARGLGMRGREGLVRLYGVREIAAGMGILLAKNPAPWVWGRVAGDALDLATLTAGLDPSNPRQGNAALAFVAVAGVTAVDAACAQALRGQGDRRQFDYSDRTGLPFPPHAMRGRARDFKVPRDMRIPEALRPYQVAG